MQQPIRPPICGQPPQTSGPSFAGNRTGPVEEEKRRSGLAARVAVLVVRSTSPAKRNRSVVIDGGDGCPAHDIRLHDLRTCVLLLSHVPRFSTLCSKVYCISVMRGDAGARALHSARSASSQEPCPAYHWHDGRGCEIATQWREA